MVESSSSMRQRSNKVVSAPAVGKQSTSTLVFLSSVTEYVDDFKKSDICSTIM